VSSTSRMPSQSAAQSAPQPLKAFVTGYRVIPYAQHLKGPRVLGMLGYTTAEPVTGPRGPREPNTKSASKRVDEILKLCRPVC